jgi:hypothetical protein
LFVPGGKHRIEPDRWLRDSCVEWRVRDRRLVACHNRRVVHGWELHQLGRRLGDGRVHDGRFEHSRQRWELHQLGRRLGDGRVHDGRFEHSYHWWTRDRRRVFRWCGNEHWGFGHRR